MVNRSGGRPALPAVTQQGKPQGINIRGKCRGCPYPRIPVKVGGTNELHAAFLNESRTRYPRWRSVRELPGISRSLRDVGHYPSEARIHTGIPLNLKPDRTHQRQSIARLHHTGIELVVEPQLPFLQVVFKMAINGTRSNLFWNRG